MDVGDIFLYFISKNIVFRNLAWLRPLELIFGEKFTARRAESEFDTFEPFFGLRFCFSAFVFFKLTFATTPAPSNSKIDVPINSAKKGCIVIKYNF